MIDLIDESGKDLKKYGYNIRHGLEFGVSLASLLIDSEEKSRQLDLAKGQYYIFNSPFLHQLQDDNEVYLSKMIARTMRKLLKNKNVTKKTRS